VGRHWTGKNDDSIHELRLPEHWGTLILAQQTPSMHRPKKKENADAETRVREKCRTEKDALQRWPLQGAARRAEAGGAEASGAAGMA